MDGYVGEIARLWKESCHYIGDRVIETRKFGLFIMSINWNYRWQEIQILSFWIPFVL